MISSKEISVVIQGAVSRETVILIRSIRKYLPEAEIVLSTWKGSKVEGMDYDKLVLNEDPGAMSAVIDPNRKYNLNRQIVSSTEGVRVATRSYVLKCRSDMELQGTGFLEYWDKYPARDSEYVLAEHKMIVPSLYTLKGEFLGDKFHPTPFHISDWCVFGLRQDVEQLCDVPLVDVKQFSRYFVYHERPIEYNVPLVDERVWQFPPEQWLGLNYAKKWRSDIDFPNFLLFENVDFEVAERFLVNNFIVAEPQESQIILNKGAYYNMCQNPLFYVEHIKDTAYQRDVYEKDYKKYCDPHFRSTYNDRAEMRTQIDFYEMYKQCECPKDEYDFAVVTPTYRGHFPFIPAYLESFSKYVTDKDKVPIYFMVGGDEYFDFCNMIRPYTDGLCVHVLVFEMVLEYFGIKEKPEKLLEKYGRFSFQTLKKFYAMLYIKKSQFLVLDSESVWIAPTEMKEEFKTFFENPFVPCSPLALRKEKAIARIATEDVENLLDHITNKWYIECFSWFYEKRILEEMFDYLKSPLHTVKEVSRFEKQKHYEIGVMEIILYTVYLEKHYGDRYKFIDVYEAFQEKLQSKMFYDYLQEVDAFYRGESGVAEHVLQFLTWENWEPLAKLYKENNFSMIRCETGSEENYILQKKFLAAAGTKILAASQDHRFLPDSDGWNEKSRKHLGSNWSFAEFRIRVRSKVKKLMMNLFPAYRVATDSRFKLESFIGETNRNFGHTAYMLENMQKQMESLRVAQEKAAKNSSGEKKKQKTMGEKK